MEEEEQVQYWCELNTIPTAQGKTKKQFKHFQAGTSVSEIRNWIEENGPLNSWQLSYEALIRPAYEEPINNPYIKFRGVKFGVNSFISMAKKYPRNFVKYCEILITENGGIYLASPSHSYMEEKLLRKGYTSICNVWYSMAIGHHLSEQQQMILEKLKEARLLSPNLVYNNT